MTKFIKSLGKDEQGSVLIVALVILVLLTLIGISSTTTTDIEVQIAGNEMEYVNDFYIADSAWREGAEWLNSLDACPEHVNLTTFLSGVSTEPGYYNVRNYGDQGNGSPTLDVNIPDGTLGVSPRTTKYWYQVSITDSGGEKAGEGFGKDEMRYNYTISSVADEDTQREIVVTVSKVY